MPSSYSVLLLHTVGRLDRELAAAAANVDDVAERLGGDPRAAFLRRSIDVVASTARMLRQHALDAMRSEAESSIDVHERAVRARANIVMRALHVLVGNEQHVPSAALSDRFRSVHDASTFLLDRIARIHARWLEQRGAAHQQDASARAALVYTALDEAEIAFERLGREAEVEQFLRVGVTSEHEEVSVACREIALTVGLQLASLQQERAASPTSGPSLLVAHGATR